MVAMGQVALVTPTTRQTNNPQQHLDSQKKQTNHEPKLNQVRAMQGSTRWISTELPLRSGFCLGAQGFNFPCFGLFKQAQTDKRGPTHSCLQDRPCCLEPGLETWQSSDRWTPGPCMSIGSYIYRYRQFESGCGATGDRDPVQGNEHVICSCCCIV